MAREQLKNLTEPMYYILLSLLQENHGYGIMQKVEEMSHGRLHMAAGTLYGALSSLQEKGWIEALSGTADSRKKEYIITQAGCAVLDRELKRLEELVANGHAVLGGK